MTKFTKLQKRAVKNLAISYSGFCSAKSDNAIATWGRILLTDQKTAGVELHNTKLVTDLVKAANWRLLEKSLTAHDKAQAKKHGEFHDYY